MTKFIILPKDVGYSFSRSSGHGGQNINKVETKVTILWDFLNNKKLSSEQKQLIIKKLSSHLNTSNQLAVTCQTTRSQSQNKLLAIERLNHLVKKALTKPKSRRSTKIPLRSKLKRLEQKKIISQKKSLRRTSLEKS